MMRLLGILVGAAIAVAVLILLVGIPTFPDEPEQVATPAIAEEPAVAIADAPAEAIATEAYAPPAPSVERVAEQYVQEDAPQDTAPPPILESDHWYAFWSPFRSELAANGFVSQLQRTTGLDYRVVKLKPGVYEVAFAYSDDADAENKLAQISAATGLDVPEG